MTRTIKQLSMTTLAIAFAIGTAACGSKDKSANTMPDQTMTPTMVDASMAPMEGGDGTGMGTDMPGPLRDAGGGPMTNP